MRVPEATRIHARSRAKLPEGRLRIAQVAPPIEPVPPPGYGGTERVVGDLVAELVARGHDVTLFASGDSTAPGKLVPTVPRALRPAGLEVPPWPYIVTTLLEVARRADDFDVIHGHLDWSGLLLPRLTTVPVVLTFHGRLDVPVADTALAEPPRGLVAISDAQASSHDIPWEAVVRNGLDLSRAPFERRRGQDICFVGRIVPEKSPVDAIEIARLTGRKLRIAAKQGWTPFERDYYDSVFKPALKGAEVELLGELSSPDRDRLMAESYVTLMPGSWPEPFGLVAIESLACGTPVISRRVGALPEIIREGVDGFFGDDVTGMAFHMDHVGDLDRSAIRKSVMRRFSAARMTDGYEAVYRRMLAGGARAAEAAASAEDRARPSLGAG
jgi:glycosyltransferase involved in cell wall biosynthesis